MRPSVSRRVKAVSVPTVHKDTAARAPAGFHGTTSTPIPPGGLSRAGPRQEFQSPMRGRGSLRATSVNTPITVRAKLACGLYAPLPKRPHCPRRPSYTTCYEVEKTRLFLACPRSGRVRSGNFHGTTFLAIWASRTPSGHTVRSSGTCPGRSSDALSGHAFGGFRAPWTALKVPENRTVRPLSWLDSTLFLARQRPGGRGGNS